MQAHVSWVGRVYGVESFESWVCLGKRVSPDRLPEAELIATRALLEARPGMVKDAQGELVVRGDQIFLVVNGHYVDKEGWVNA